MACSEAARIAGPRESGRIVVRLAAALAALSAIPAVVAGQDPLGGEWQGYWTRAGDTLPVMLTIRRDAATGAYAAEFGADRLRARGIPFAAITVTGCCEVTMVLRGDRTTAVFAGQLHGDSLSGVLREEGGDGRFVYARSKTAEPAFEEQEVTFVSGTVTLAGSLLLPAGGDSLPAVVFLHGSGPEGRWASRYLAEQLAGNGIAALIYDKRGVGGSGGDWRGATPDDLVADGAAALARLLEEPRIDSRRIGVHGHSQGGTLAPMAAVRAGAAFVVGSAAAGTPPDSTELFSVLNWVLAATASARDSADARAYVGELVAVAYRGRPAARLDSLAAAFHDRSWFFDPPPPGDGYWSLARSLGQYDPLVWWGRVRVPVLLLYGAADERVPAMASASRIAATLRDAGNRDVTVRVFPAADHTFRLPPGPSAWPVTAPDYVPTLLGWLGRR